LDDTVMTNARFRLLLLHLSTLIALVPDTAMAFLLAKKVYAEPVATSDWLNRYREIYSDSGETGLEKLAQDGDTRAAYALFTLSLLGSGPRLDFDGSFQQLARFSSEGIIEADYLLGTMYWSCPDAEDSGSRCREQTYSALVRAASANYPPAISALAQLQLYSSDEAKKISNSVAAKMLERAVIMGDGNAMAALADLLALSEDNSEAQMTRIRELRSRASQLGVPMELIRRAVELERIGGAENLETAFASLVQAEGEFEVQASVALGKFLLRHPSFSDRVPKSAEELLSYACDRGVTGVCADAAMLVLQRRDKRDAAEFAVVLLERGVSRQDVRSLTTLANLLAEGEVISRDDQRAIELWTMAANAGGTTAMFNLALILLRPTMSYHDRDAAIGWLKRAAAAGHGRAATRLRELQDY
jgi:TPR repeat protein